MYSTLAEVSSYHHYHMMSTYGDYYYLIIFFFLFFFLKNDPSLVSRPKSLHLTLEMYSFLSSFLLCAPGGWLIWTPSSDSHALWLWIVFN